MTEPKTADVMCRRVVTAAPDATFKELVGTMIVHEVSMIPVVDSAGRPVGMVTEEDLATKLEFHGGAANPPMLGGAHTRARWHKSSATVAAELMTPSVSVAENADLRAALRLLAGVRVGGLCVVNGAGTLVGVLGRLDALRLFLRGDNAIRADLERQLRPVSTNEHRVTVRVVDGAVTLDGGLCLRSATQRAEWIARAVPGVIAVRNNLGFDVDDLMITGL
ncbi:CBS domain-containing protein [Lentzea sp. NPDC051838]|uniref:CBS domain-containing protein n=1 Tax=Lentzea sp. NPDC051838 TaxID=3154849 RepID=UPI003431A573